jgi:hypothetical protein
MNTHLLGPKGPKGKDKPIPRCPPMQIHLQGPKGGKDKPIPRCPPMDFFEISKK